MDKNGSIENRKILPRWRELKRTPEWETQSINQKIESPDNAHRDLKFYYERWQKDPSLENAIEVVDSAVLTDNRALAVGPAKQILKNSAAPSLLKLAEFVLKGDLPRTLENEAAETSSFDAGKPTPQEQIRSIKDRLQDEPRNGLLWLELSRLHVSQGQFEPAEKSMMKSLGAAPNNRLILRAATRLFQHLDKKEIAYEKIRNSEIVKHDPWIQAIDISLASLLGKTPKDFKKRIKFIEEADINPIHLSELASAAATEEIGAGEMKMARKLFKKSLMDPTEVVVAQALWANEHHMKLEMAPEIPLNTKGAFEARSLSAFNNRQYKDSMSHALSWQWDEPFSSKSALHGSFVATSFLENQELAINIITESLRANPNSQELLNNLVVAYARDNQMTMAQETLKKLHKGTPAEDQENPTHLATTGLVYFRDGNADLGRNYYKKALEQSHTYDSMNRTTIDTSFRVKAHWLYEEINAKTLSQETFRGILDTYESQAPKIKRALPITTQLLWEEMAKQMKKTLDQERNSWSITSQGSDITQVIEGIF